jgi:NAD(P)-dependent dehydrogenase (short-subunit alcohol dehydrogenase family)
MLKPSRRGVRMDLKSKTALVTGGAVRIGRAICGALADCGCGVVVHHEKSEIEAAELVKSLSTESRAFAVRGALDSWKGCEAVLEKAWETAGGIDILVNNAAVFSKAGLMSVMEGDLMKELSVNFLAPVALTRAFAARLSDGSANSVSHPAGKVINLLDTRIAGNAPGCVSYLLSKKMLAEFTGIAALELAPLITVNGVAPGAVLPPPESSGQKDLAGHIPLNRRPTPEDVAGAVVFLLESDAITGQTIFVDGGQHLGFRTSDCGLRNGEWA